MGKPEAPLPEPAMTDALQLYSAHPPAAADLLPDGYHALDPHHYHCSDAACDGDCEAPRPRRERAAFWAFAASVELTLLVLAAAVLGLYVLLPTLRAPTASPAPANATADFVDPVFPELDNDFQGRASAGRASSSPGFVGLAAWPAPAAWSADTRTYRVLNALCIQRIAVANTSAGPSDAFALISEAVQRAQSRMQKLVPLPALATHPLCVDVAITDPSTDAWGAGERYSLQVPSSGAIRITADTAVGALRAIATLPQLLGKNAVRAVAGRSGSPLAWAMQPTVVSNDKPAYPYRGIMVDTARHYIPLTDLRRTLDGMEVAKMNRLHLHLYDSQSFPLRWPGPDGQGKLWQLGAFKDAAGNPLTYSAEELAELSRYAARRGIVLVPEFDVPAHTDVFVLAYPDNMACKPDMARPSGQLQILRDSTYPLVADLLAWGMDTAFPSSPAMHVGQDEVHKWCFNWDEIVPNEQYSFLASASRFQGMLTDEIVNKRGRTLMAWEDLVTPSTMDGQGLNAEGGVPDDGTVVPRRDSLLVEAWRSMDTYRWLLGKGYRTLFSVSSYWYLSCGQWCNPGTGSISMTWAYNAPLPATGTNPNAAGGEVAFWTEETNAQVLDKVIWPRAGAAAERLWSNPGADRSRKLCTEARTAELNRQLAAVGIDAWPASTVMN